MAQNYLSNLSATKDDPLFATYAAPLQRSEFIIDEGYHLNFYQVNEGINFVTDESGDLGLAFKLNEEIRYLLSQMYSQPVITTSYCDLVKYHYQPFSDIQVQVFFQVFSSRIAIQEVSITNTRNHAVQIDLYPFMNHPYSFDNAAIAPDTSYFSFTHREDPDSWTISHSVPYEDVLQNVFMMSDIVDAFGSYGELGIVPQPSANSASGIENYCVEWGLVHHADGSSCTHVPTDAQQIIFHNGSPQEILTEDAPKWGDPDPNIPGNGYQGCELGNFRNPTIASGDSFTVIFSCLATGQQGYSNSEITILPTPAGIYTPVQLSVDSFPTVPQNVNIQFSLSYNSAVINWDQMPGLLYSVYRRTESTPGRYDQIADSLIWPGYLDLDLNPDSSYGYVVIARDSLGRFSPHSLEVGNIGTRPFFQDMTHAHLYNSISPFHTRVVAFQKTLLLQPGVSRTVRIIRGVTEENGNLDSLIVACKNLMVYNMDQAVIEDEALYSQIPQFNFPNPDYEMMYWNAFNLMRQCMLPPEGESSYDYYVFSREPTWGWGHGGQVFHESLTMLAYGFMDPVSAMNSQRVFMERQWQDGYINYRTGPYLNETIPYASQYTTSAPWYNWENWELFKISQDTAFLQEIYPSGKKLYLYWLNNRDSDQDGLCEWGAHAVLECVRDGQVAIWDQVGWPSNFECLDLNCMLVNEAHSLAEMAEVLGLSAEAQMWRQEATARADSINKYMWDAQSGFYYHVDKIDHDFTFNSADDLKRQEIIGFLPLWAGVTNSQQVSQLVQRLIDPNKFWRNYGVPTLSADDPYYNPMGYWNGPVWVQWQYLIFRGLLNYGYTELARDLASRVMDQVIYQLKENHWFWELYSPDDQRAGWHKAYIWTGLVSRMLIDLDSLSTTIVHKENEIPATVELLQNFPNPFNPITEIYFKIPRSQQVKLTVYDILGRRMKNILNDKLDAGKHRVTWDGTDELNRQVSSGIYFYQIEMETHTLAKKMILVH